MTYRRTLPYWIRVRAHVALQAQAWSCGTEGRLLFENLCLHEDWPQRLADLCPVNRSLSPDAAARAIVTNYYNRALFFARNSRKNPL